MFPLIFSHIRYAYFAGIGPPWLVPEVALTGELGELDAGADGEAGDCGLTDSLIAISWLERKVS